LSLPEVRRREFLVFLDDDVSLPHDWLGRLGAAAALAPRAQVWGCRVVDEANPLVAQSVDYTPLAPRPPHEQSLLMHLPLHAPSPARLSGSSAICARASAFYGLLPHAAFRPPSML
jgi:hypothetical protein